MFESRMYDYYNFMQREVKKIYSQAFPIQSGDLTLELVDVEIKRVPFDSPSYVRKVKANEKTLVAPIVLRLRLKKGSQVIDEGEVTVGSLPVISPLGTFIYRGNDYVIPNQLRLKPAIYTQELPDGTIRAKFNVKNGENFAILYSPSKKTMRLVVNQVSVDLIPFLQALGVNEAQLRTVLGDAYNEIRARSAKIDMDKVLNALKTKRYSELWPSNIDQLPPNKQLQVIFSKTELDDKVTKITVGQPFDRVSVQAILQAARRVLEIAQGKAEPSEPSGVSSLPFKKLVIPEEQILEKINLGVKLLKQTAQDRMQKYDRIKDIIPPNYTFKPVRGFFAMSSAVRFLQSVNPYSILSANKQVTITGEGAIEDDRAITVEDRSLDPHSLGFIDPVHTPETNKIGATTFMTFTSIFGLHRGRPGEILNWFLNPKTGELELKAPIDLHDKVVAFPDALKKQFRDSIDITKLLSSSKTPKVKVSSGMWQLDEQGLVPAMKDGKITKVKPSEVDYVIFNAYQMFGPATNMLPALQSLQANRAMMAAKHMTHVVSLAKSEQPLVQTRFAGTPYTYEQAIATFFHLRSPVNGTVQEIDEENKVIKIKGDDGKIHKVEFFKDYPLAEGNFFSHRVLVKPGDRVRVGQIIAFSNNEDNGVFAYGTNLKIAYMPFEGLNYEDGIVISESTAKKLASEHVYTYELKLDDDTKLISPAEFRSLFPRTYEMSKLSNIEPSGVIKKGAVVEPNTSLILAVRSVKPTLHEAMVGEKFKQKLSSFSNATIEYEEPSRGEVVDVIRTGNTVKVLVKTTIPASVGDKIVARHGNKGTIAAVIPGEEMPKDENGEPMEVIYNPIGVVSRLNPSQLFESALGKVARKIGKPITVDNFDEKDMASEVRKLLKEHGLKEKEYLTYKGERLERPVFTGVEYFVKLPQMAHMKTTIRKEWGYDIDLQPLKGSSEEGGARTIDPLTFYSLLAHGAEKNIQEMATYKAEKNDEFWLSIELGKVPPAPKPTFVFRKFESQLKAAGINVEKKGDELLIRPVSKDDIEKLKPVEIEKPTMLNAVNMLPEKGGLFDPEKLGGIYGDKWGGIKLPQPVLNPVFKQQTSVLLGLPLTTVEKLNSGELAVTEDNEIVPASSPKAKYFGGEAIQKLIKHKIKNGDIDKALEEVRQKLESTTNPKEVGTLAKQFRMLNAVKNKPVNPEDFVMSEVLVVPPKFRPAVELEEGGVAVSPLNYAYRDLLLAKQTLENAKKTRVVTNEKQFKQLASNLLSRQVEKLMFAVPTGRSAMEPKGIMPIIAGHGGPKTGLVHSKIFRKRQELSSTAVLQNGPELGVDEVVIPEEMAWNLYKPFVIKQLTTMGYDIIKAKELIEQKDEVAKKALIQETERRPVLVNRPPSLHKFNIMAFKPVLIPSSSEKKPEQSAEPVKRQELVLRMNPLVMKGFNADNDGDTVAVFVPVTDAARREAIEKLMPSKNVIRPVYGDIMVIPRAEYIQGIYNITALKPKQNKPIANYGQNYEKLFRDWKARMIKGDDYVVFYGIPATVGQHLVNGLFPKMVRNYKKPISNKELTQMYMLAMRTGKNFDVAHTSDMLKEIGRLAMTMYPVTIGISDIDDKKYKQELQPLIRQAKKVALTNPDKLVELAGKIDETIKQKAEQDSEKNDVLRMMVSGAKGNPEQVRQLLVTPLATSDSKGNVFPFAVERSYSEGLKPSEYFATSFGARASMISKKMGVAEPGAVNKELLVSTSDLIVIEDDDPNDMGVPISLSKPDKDILGRIAAQTIKKGNRILVKEGEPITPKVLEALRKEKLKEVYVKSILTATTPAGIPATAVGITAEGKLPQKGTNIGVQYVQAITEPLSQGTLNLFHTGGAARKSKAIGNILEEVEFFTRMPASKMDISATLSTLYGRVTKIEKLATGGWNVYVEDKPHFVSPRLEVIVKVGDIVKKGDPLSSGPIHPAKFLEVRNNPYEAMLKTTEQLTKVLNEGGIKVPMVATEPIARGLMSTAIVTDNGGIHEVQVGEYYPVQHLDALNRKHGASGTKEVSKAIGERTAEHYGTVMAGTLIDQAIAKELEQQGFKKVKTYRDVIKYKIVLAGSQTQPAYRSDWLHKLTTGRIAQNLSFGAASGDRSKLTGFNSPNAAWIIGTSRYFPEK